MLTGRIEKTETGIHAILETDSLASLAEAIHAKALHERLSVLIAAVDLERGKWERDDSVNDALTDASALLAMIDAGGLGHESR